MSVHKYNDIVKKAKTCYITTKKQYKNGISYKWSYYICKAILTKSDVKKIGVQDAPNPVKGEYISHTIDKADYTKIIKNFIAFVENKKRLPNYVLINNKKVSVKLYTAFVSYILYKYSVNGKYPTKQTIKTDIYKKPETLHDYLTNEGCNGMGQCTSYYCGPNSLQQMFYRLTGIKVDESTIAGWAGTTTDGTDHDGLNTAVAMFNKKYNKNVKIEWYNFSELGFDKCKELMKKGALFFHLLYRNKYGHYEVPKTIYENTLDILNSLGDKCGTTSYCGYIENRTKAEQKSYISGISQKSVAYLYNG